MRQNLVRVISSKCWMKPMKPSLGMCLQQPCIRPQLLKVSKCTQKQSVGVCHIHLSSKYQAIPPVVLVVIRPLMKLGAMVFGRFIRKRWQGLSDTEKDIVKSKIRARQAQIAFASVFIVGTGILFYLEQVKEEPITKRKRFIIYNDEQMKTIAQLEYDRQIEEFKSDLLPAQHPTYGRVARVAYRILQSNQHLDGVKQKEWAVVVVDRPDITNAFVLPHGKIFVFTGMLNVCTNEDQLAVVMAHEIAHAVLSHMAESLSKVFLVEMLLLVPLVVFWALFSDVGALFSQWLSSKLAEIMIHLPFSRAIETEADEVGLFLAAKACFDVREAPVFWAKMNLVGEAPVPVEWLSTHPSHESRQTDLTEMLPSAIKIRDENKCPLLPPLSEVQAFYSRQHGHRLPQAARSIH